MGLVYQKLWYSAFMAEEQRRTPTATLMAALEDFGEDEPRECIVIYTTASGDMAWSCSSDAVSVKLGLIEACKLYIQEKARTCM